MERYDCVYVRNGTASLFLAFEPLAGWRHVAVTGSRKRGDWARFAGELLGGRYAEAEKRRHAPARPDRPSRAGQGGQQ